MQIALQQVGLERIAISGDADADRARAPRGLPDAQHGSLQLSGLECRGHCTRRIEIYLWPQLTGRLTERHEKRNSVVPAPLRSLCAVVGCGVSAQGLAKAEVGLAVLRLVDFLVVLVVSQSFKGHAAKILAQRKCL